MLNLSALAAGLSHIATVSAKSYTGNFTNTYAKPQAATQIRIGYQKIASLSGLSRPPASQSSKT